MEKINKNNNTKVEENSEDCYDKTLTINTETDAEEYDIKKRKNQFINFCKQKRSLKKVRPGRVKLLNENNEEYVSIQCKSGDCPEKDKKGNITTERNELWLENSGEKNKNESFEFNKPYSYKFSFRIPENFPLSPTRLVIGQRKFNKLDGSKESDGPSPILAQRIKKIGGKYYFIITDSHKKQLGKKIPFDDIKGKRVNMEYKINFSDKKDVESSVEIIANIDEGEGKRIRIIVYNGSYNIRDDENKFQLNPRKNHTGYFKFGLYRDNYDYAKKKIEKDDKISEEGKSLLIDEIEKAKNSENENPMEIHFKDFSMEDLNYDEIKQEKQQSKNKQLSWVKKLIEKLRHEN